MMRRTQAACLWFSVLVLVIRAGAGTPPDATDSNGESPRNKRGRAPNEPFIILPQSEVVKPDFGMAMIRPQQDHGTVDEAYGKLQRILADWPADRPSTIWITRVNQVATLERFAPLVDRVVTNPFVHVRDDVFPGGDPVWPGCNHPFLNAFREMHAKNGGARLLALVEVPGEPEHFTNRPASVEEVEWMVYAVIGGNFKGILWRGRPEDDAMTRRIGRLEARIKAHAEELGKAVPVDWARPPEGQWASALATDKTLFVVLLSGEYLRPDPVAQQVVLPLKRPAVSGDLGVVTPEGVVVRSARTLAGERVSVEAASGKTSLPFAFVGAGEIIVCELARAGQETK